MPAEQPALMICNHAGECYTGICTHKTPHGKILMCNASTYHLFPDAVCVPWVEPVVHTSCEGCASRPYHAGICAGCGEPITGLRHNYTPAQPEQLKHRVCDGCHHEHSAAESQRCAACRDYDDINDAGQVYHRFWTPAQPEPDAPVNRPCSTCGWMVGGLCGCTIACDGDQWKPRTPTGGEELASYDIKKTNEHTGDSAQWICPFGYLPDLAGFVDFDHIELKSGATVTTLQAFSKDDPPVKAYFRKA